MTKRFFLSDEHARRDEQRLKKLNKELDKLHKYIPAQKSVIEKNRSSRGWGHGYVAAYGARKAIRKLRHR